MKFFERKLGIVRRPIYIRRESLQESLHLDSHLIISRHMDRTPSLILSAFHFLSPGRTNPHPDFPHRRQ
jgi:hypothetical protein